MRHTNYSLSKGKGLLRQNNVKTPSQDCSTKDSDTKYKYILQYICYRI